MSSSILYEPKSGILRLDDATVLLDCCCTDIDSLTQVKIDAILVSHGTMQMAMNIPLLLLSNKYSSAFYRNLYTQSEGTAAGTVDSGQEVQIFCTWPVAQMMYASWLTVQSAHFQSHGKPYYYCKDLENDNDNQNQASDQDIQFMDDVDAFHRSNKFLRQLLSSVRTVKYNESITLFSSSKSVILGTALRAGHSIGGSMWKLVISDALMNIDNTQNGGQQIPIQSSSMITSANDSVLYMPIINHRKDRHINGADILQKANVLISGVGCVQIDGSQTVSDGDNDVDVISQTVLPRSARDKILFDYVSNTVGAGGDVLIPVEMPRILELSLLLDTMWSLPQLNQYHDLILCLPQELQQIFDLVKGMLEWMGDAVISQFEQSRESVYAFKHMKIMNADQFDAYYKQSRAGQQQQQSMFPTGMQIQRRFCVLTVSNLMLEGDLSVKLFMQYFYNSSLNLLLFTQQPPINVSSPTLGQSLFEHYIAKLNFQRQSQPLKIDINWTEKQELDEIDLATYTQKKQDEQDQKLLDEAVQRRKQQLLNEQLVGEDEEEDGDNLMGKSGEKPLNAKAGISANQLPFQLQLQYKDWDQDADRILFQNRHDWVLKPLVAQKDSFTQSAAMNEDGVIDEGYDDMNDFAIDQEKPVSFPAQINYQLSDEYGEVIDLDHFKKFKETVDDDGDVMNMASRKMSVEDSQQLLDASQSSNMDPWKDLTPKRLNQKRVQISVLCQVKYIDLESVSDPKSMLNVISHINAKNCVLIEPDQRLIVSSQLKRALIDNMPDMEVHIPDRDQMDLSSDVNVWKIKLTDSLLQSVQMKPLNDMELGYVSGVVQMIDNVPVLDVSPQDVRWMGHQDIPVGDLKLSQLRQKLTTMFNNHQKSAMKQKRRIRCEFDRGNLIIEDLDQGVQCRVIRDPNGALIIEGPFSKLFWKVRKVIYSMHAIV
ncbi:hypothetical protein MP228_011962 [Amoeboaphelidium protococcarum]|nr:hypothetical protein MP228_011962 [Amoeboaphelidium protococcarum]